jgi:hypothetical protein
MKNFEGEWQHICNDGSKRWYNSKGQLHREDGPAIEWRDGSKHWYINNQLHRIGGPAIERPTGDKEWYINNRLHREDGPAIDYGNGTQEWFINGLPHRLDGPAIIYRTKHSQKSHKIWFIHGRRIDVSSNEEFLRIVNFKVFL